MTDLRTTPLKELINLMEVAAVTSDQSLLNKVAYEVTTRLYIPESEKSFDEMLVEFGYSLEESEPQKQKTFTRKK
jgi:hypothetical protein